MIEQDIKIKWTCNSRVDYVDEEMLQLMGKAGCWYIAWGLESGNEEVLHHAHKGISLEKAQRGLKMVKTGGNQQLGILYHRPANRN